MKKLSGKGQKWLKSLHIYAGCVWVGCATTLTIMQFFVNAEDGGELYGGCRGQGVAGEVLLREFGGTFEVTAAEDREGAHDLEILEHGVQQPER